MAQKKDFKLTYLLQQTRIIQAHFPEDALSILANDEKNLHHVLEVAVKEEPGDVKQPAPKKYPYKGVVKRFKEVKALSIVFVRILNEWLTPEQIAEVNKFNAVPENSRFCGTHNFCDPNQAMIDAFTEIYKRECEALNDADNELINAAWDLSKMHKFNPNFYKSK